MMAALGAILIPMMISKKKYDGARSTGLIWLQVLFQLLFLQAFL